MPICSISNFYRSLVDFSPVFLFDYLIYAELLDGFFY